jgi:hypothetical protein
MSLVRKACIAAVVLGLGAMVVHWHLNSAVMLKHVEMSVHQQRELFKHANPNVRIQYNAIERAGFPLTPSVRVLKPTFSVVQGQESYAVGFDEAVLTRVGKTLHYDVEIIGEAHAVYAVPGHAPEQYVIRLNAQPKVQLVAYDAANKAIRCVPMRACAKTGTVAEAFNMYGMKLPEVLVFTARLGKKSRDIRFDIPAPLSLLMQEKDIPKNIAPALQMAVGVLREALVFQ